ncbi:hypothetical protein GCM10027614_00610 [Micromonospora vulcania]
MKDATVASGRGEVGRKGIETSLFLGYTPTSTGESVSWALEGFINDYGIGNMGAALAKDGHPEVRARTAQGGVAVLPGACPQLRQPVRSEDEALPGPRRRRHLPRR